MKTDINPFFFNRQSVILIDSNKITFNDFSNKPATKTNSTLTLRSDRQTTTDHTQEASAGGELSIRLLLFWSEVIKLASRLIEIR